MDNLDKILEEFSKYGGEFVITRRNTVERLIAVLEDEIDYCYVYFNGREFSFDSCLCKFIPLKNKIDDDDYNTLVRLAKLNHIDQICSTNSLSQYIEVIGKFETRLLTYGTIHSRIQWDLN